MEDEDLPNVPGEDLGGRKSRKQRFEERRMAEQEARMAKLAEVDAS